MYNTDFICTYVFYDEKLWLMNPFSKNNLETIQRMTEEDTKEEKESWSDYLYKTELTHAFDLELEGVVDAISVKVDALFDHLVAQLDDASLREFFSVFEIENPVFRKVSSDLEKVSTDLAMASSDLARASTDLTRASTDLTRTPCDLKSSIDLDTYKDNFSVLFSYDYYHMTHLCIVDLLRHGKCSEENIEYLKKALSVVE